MFNPVTVNTALLESTVLVLPLNVLLTLTLYVPAVLAT
ncbi:unannotated protein [freshwater metagenome]|uniref:Unannotated protein n=1 Tax=freshwater metagenome TaxID=449393 RepID=A0A6J6AHW7_9ZZZZ